MTFEKLLELVSLADGPGVCIDSRKVEPGDIFVAVEGSICDGHDFIETAVAAGAKYIVCQRPCRCKKTHVVVVDDSVAAAALLAQASCGNPASKLINLAVTGTNGKTTVAFLVQSIIKAAGEKCGLISTILYDTVDQCILAQLTTPDCITIAQMQRQMAGAGAKYMITEASSHSLYQNRLAGIDFAAAAFTNLSGDHLDYHQTRENYFTAKSILFEQLSTSATAVLNKSSKDVLSILNETNVPSKERSLKSHSPLNRRLNTPPKSMKPN